MTTAIQNVHDYLENFTAFEKRATGRNLPWLRRLRDDAFARFCEVGFPTTHDEDWRFTNVSAIARTPFLLKEKRKVRLSKKDLAGGAIEGAPAQLVFVDGQFVRELSHFTNISRGVTI